MVENIKISADWLCLIVEFLTPHIYENAVGKDKGALMEFLCNPWSMQQHESIVCSVIMRQKWCEFRVSKLSMFSFVKLYHEEPNYWTV